MDLMKKYPDGNVQHCLNETAHMLKQFGFSPTDHTIWTDDIYKYWLELELQKYNSKERAAAIMAMGYITHKDRAAQDVKAAKAHQDAVNEYWKSHHGGLLETPFSDNRRDVESSSRDNNIVLVIALVVIVAILWINFF